MAYQVVWADPALRDLERIFAFIAQDSERYAIAQVRKLLASVTRLEQFPFSGRATSIGYEPLREIVVLLTFCCMKCMKKEAAWKSSL